MLARLRSTLLTTAPMPSPPVRNFSFTDWAVNNPTAPPPGDRLDSNFDQTNQAVAEVITWASVSLNSDGTLRDNSVGQNALAHGLFDKVANGVLAEVQPLVDEAESFAVAAAGSLAGVRASATTAELQATAAAGSAAVASAAANAAGNAEKSAQMAAAAAAAAISTLDNAANHAADSEARAQLYAEAAAAWAEHMPDTIPPNTLAIMGITGDHWSSRWWANEADRRISAAQADIEAALAAALDQIDQKTTESIAAIEASVKTWYLGALPNNPDEIPAQIGCLYFNTSTGDLMVWNGEVWSPAVGVSMGAVAEYRFHPGVGTTILQGTDLNGNTLVCEPFNTVSVWRNGLKLLDPTDYTVGTNKIVLNQAADGLSTYAIDVTSTSASVPMILTVKLNLTSWAPDGNIVTFPLRNAANANVAPLDESDVLFSMDGVWLEAGKDFTVAGSNITFAQAPANDSNLFGILGVPVGGPSPP